MALRDMQEILAPADVEAKEVAKKQAEVKEKEAAEKKATEKIIDGIVVSVGPLNVRKEPEVNPMNIVGTVNKGEVVKVNVKKSNPDWVYLKSLEGVEGYSMKKFVKVDLK